MMKTLSRAAICAVIALSLAACGGKSGVEKADDKEATVAEVAAEVVNSRTGAPEAGVVNTIADGAMVSPADLPVIIDFSAVWCGPCKRFAPTFEASAKEYAGKFYFYTVDIDKCPDMAQTYSVQSIPQVSVLYPDGRIVNNKPGFMEKEQFDEWLNAL